MKQQSEPKSLPIATIRSGGLKAAIWLNETEQGPRYAVTFARTYRNQDGNYRDTTSLREKDLLTLSWLAEQAYAAIKELKTEAIVHEASS